MSTIFEESGEDGRKSTIIHILGDILNYAESKYGQRDIKYTLLGVYVSKAGPSYWFPSDKHIAIYLSQSAFDNMTIAVGELAHEIIHLLNPVSRYDVNFLEEGLAVHFSIEYTKKNGYDFIIKDEKYLRALDLYEKLIKIEADIINKIRSQYSTISLITSDDLIKINDKIPIDLAEKRTQKFNP